MNEAETRAELIDPKLGIVEEKAKNLEVGDALIVGDASLLPSRVIINKPTIPPDNATIDF